MLVMQARRSRREERKAETRHELIQSALRVFAARGFHAASVQEIAQAAGYTTGAIYFHFGGKDELFLAAFEAFAITRVGELDAVEFADDEPFPQRARRLADQWMARQAVDPTFLVVALEFVAHAWRNPQLREAFAARAAAVRLAVGRFVEQEARADALELPMESAAIATALRELGVGLAVAKLADPDAVSNDLYGDFVELFFELATRNSRAPRGQHGKRNSSIGRGGKR